MLAGRVVPQISMSADGVRAARQHRQLNLARDLELALQGQPIRHFEQHEEIDHQQADQERKRPVRPGGEQHGDLEERRPERNVDHREAAKQLDQAEERKCQRPKVERAPGRRQLECEGDEDLAEPNRELFPPRQPPDLLFVEPAAEETVGVARVVREEPLQVFRRQITGIGVEPFPRAIAAELFIFVCSRGPTPANAWGPTPTLCQRLASLGAAV